MSTQIEYDVNLLYFLLRTVLAFLSLISLVLKLPFTVYAITYIIDTVPTFLKSSGGSNSDMPSPYSSNKMKTSFIIEITLNLLFLVFIFVGVLVQLLKISYRLLRYGRCNPYQYLMVMGTWLIFILTAVLVDGWGGIGNYAILAAKSLIIGSGFVDAPSSWHLIMLRISLVIDLVAYPAMAGIAFLNFKFSLSKEEKVGMWSRCTNWIRNL